MAKKKKCRPANPLVAFLAIWAVDFANQRKLNGLHPVHYTLLKKHGARMDSFKEATNASEEK